MVGVNAFRAEQEPRIPTLKVDEAVQATQIQRLREVRAERSAARVADALGALERAARDGANVVGPVLEAVKSYATRGEIRTCSERSTASIATRGG